MKCRTCQSGKTSPRPIRSGGTLVSFSCECELKAFLANEKLVG